MVSLICLSGVDANFKLTVSIADGGRPLHAAASRSHPEAVTILLNHGREDRCQAGQQRTDGLAHGGGQGRNARDLRGGRHPAPAGRGRNRRRQRPPDTGRLDRVPVGGGSGQPRGGFRASAGAAGERSGRPCMAPAGLPGAVPCSLLRQACAAGVQDGRQDDERWRDCCKENSEWLPPCGAVEGGGGLGRCGEHVDGDRVRPRVADGRRGGHHLGGDRWVFVVWGRDCEKVVLSGRSLR